MREFAALSSVLILVVLACGQHEVADESSRTAPTTPMDVLQRVVVTGSVVNLREGPGTQYGIVGTAVSGDSLTVMGEAEDWYRVYDQESCLFAWIYAPLTSSTE